MAMLHDAVAQKPASPSVPPTPSARYNERFRQRLTTATLVLLFVVLIIYLLDRLSSILQPLAIACFILYALLPVKNWLQRRGLPNWMAYVLILTTVLGGLLALGTFAYDNLYQLNPENLSRYEESIDRQLNRALQAAGLGTEPVRVRELIPGIETTNFASAVGRASGTFFSFLTAAAIVGVYLFFLLLEMAGFPKRVREAFGSEEANGTLEVADQINEAVGSYLSVLTFVSLLQGGLSTVVLGALGIDFFLLWGLLIALLNLIPYLGLVGVAMPVLFAFLLHPDEPWRGLTALGLLVTIQLVVDNVITPRLTGHKLGVSPLLVLLALAFWGWLWGPVGLVLAVPLTVSLKIVLEQVPATRPIAVLMRDR